MWWLKASKENKYIHVIANGRKKRNSIHSLIYDENIVHDEATIIQSLSDHFSSQVGIPDCSHVKLNSLLLRTMIDAIILDQLIALVAPFLSAISSQGENKSLRLMGQPQISSLHVGLN